MVSVTASADGANDLAMGHTALTTLVRSAWQPYGRTYYIQPVRYGEFEHAFSTGTCACIAAKLEKHTSRKHETVAWNELLPHHRNHLQDTPFVKQL